MTTNSTLAMVLYLLLIISPLLITSHTSSLRKQRRSDRQLFAADSEHITEKITTKLLHSLHSNDPHHSSIETYTANPMACVHQEDVLTECYESITQGFNVVKCVQCIYGQFNPSIQVITCQDGLSEAYCSSVAGCAKRECPESCVKEFYEVLHCIWKEAGCVGTTSALGGRVEEGCNAGVVKEEQQRNEEGKGGLGDEKKDAAVHPHPPRTGTASTTTTTSTTVALTNTNTTTSSRPIKKKVDYCHTRAHVLGNCILSKDVSQDCINCIQAGTSDQNLNPSCDVIKQYQFCQNIATCANEHCGQCSFEFYARLNCKLQKIDGCEQFSCAPGVGGGTFGVSSLSSSSGSRHTTSDVRNKQSLERLQDEVERQYDLIPSREGGGGEKEDVVLISEA